mmetsp:Transcript_97251/g.280639  ORF Transcript_97251/g.280639 Transcript_97251/m.280639 type:complete len:514 (+) Transcript_97251:78-1619(+)
MAAVGARVVADEHGSGTEVNAAVSSDDVTVELDTVVPPWARVAEAAASAAEPSPLGTPAVAGADSRLKPSAGSMLDIAYRLRYMVGFLWLSVLQYGAVAPSLVYISTSFFAGPGNDCEDDPGSDPCKRGAADLAYYKGLLSGISQAFAWLFALTLGSFSDSIGRRPLFRAKTVLAVAPALALAGHEFGGVTLWVFLVVNAVYSAFDTNGVFLAFMSDVIVDPQQRSMAYAVIIISFVVGAGPVVAVSLVPARTAVTISAIAAIAKVAYVESVFPETLQGIDTGGPRQFGLLSTCREARRVFGRNSFILRTAAILILSGLSSAGMGTVVTPILTGYLGLRKQETTLLIALGGVSALLAMVVVLKPLTRRLGEVPSLRICLVAAAVYPSVFAYCTELWHLAVLNIVLIGPLILQFPIISAIKSNLVSSEEQGLVQGALAAIRVVAVAIADIFFGWFFREATDGGTKPRESTYPTLLGISALAFAAFLIALSLPKTPPTPPTRSPCQGEARSECCA